MANIAVSVERILQYLYTFCMSVPSMKNSNQILHNDGTELQENFYTVDHATCPPPQKKNSNAEARSICGS